MLRALGLIGCVVLVARMDAQVPVTRLAPADVRFLTEFQPRSMNRLIEPLQSVHELSDGRVLIRIDKRVVRADPKTGAGERLFDFDGILLPVSGDTTVLADRNVWRFFVSGALERETARPNAVLDYFAERLIEPFAFDQRGFIYTEIPGRQPADSQVVVRIHRTTGAAEEIARLHLPRLLPGGVCMGFERPAYFTDGWIAFLRDNPYRVDWLTPTGAWTRGAPVRVPNIPVTEAEKKAYHAWEGSDRDRIFPDMELSDIEWPPTMCAWHAAYHPLAMPDGRVLIFRMPTTTTPPTRYDVVNRRGEVERQLTMDANQAIIGFGKGTIYVRTIAHGAATVSRHPVTF